MSSRTAVNGALRWSRLRSGIGPALLVLASLAVVLVHVPQHAQISPIDEYVYIDYLAKVPTQLFVHQGEETGEYARNYLSCHGVTPYGPMAEQFCNVPMGPASAYPYAGLSSGDIYAPLYFATTWVLAQPLQFFGVAELVDAARYTGFFWLAGAALLLFFTMRRLKVGRLLAATLGLAVVGSAPAFWSNTFVSTDSPALFAGSLLAFLLVRLDNSIVLSWGLILAASVVTMLKIQNFAAVAVVIICLLVAAGSSAWERRSEGKITKGLARDKRVQTALLMGVAPMVLQVAWVIFRSSQSLGVSADQSVAQIMTKKDLMGEVFKFFGTGANNAIQLPSDGFLTVIAPHVLGWMMIAGVLGTLAFASRRLITHTMSLGVLIVALTMGPALVLATWVFVGIYVPLPVRYGLILMPMMLVPAAVMFSQKKTVAAAVSAACVVCFLTGFAL